MYRWSRSNNERLICLARHGLSSIVAICLAFILLPIAQGAETHIQQPNAARDDQQKPPEYSTSIETGLVLLDVLVTDEDGNILSGLKKGNFRILDQGKAQTISYFAPAADPITIVILMEYSGLAYDYFAYKAAYWGSGFLRHCVRSGRLRGGTAGCTLAAEQKRS